MGRAIVGDEAIAEDPGRKPTEAGQWRDVVSRVAGKGEKRRVVVAPKHAWMGMAGPVLGLPIIAGSGCKGQRAAANGRWLGIHIFLPRLPQQHMILNSR